MEDKEFSLIFEIICCFHPTEYDPVGCDGLYVKEINRLDIRPIPIAPDALPCDNCELENHGCSFQPYTDECESYRRGSARVSHKSIGVNK